MLPKSTIYKIYFYYLVIPTLIAIGLSNYAESWHYSNQITHSLTEVIGAILALVILVPINIYKNKLPISGNMLTWFTYALVCMAILDIFHAFVPVGNSFVWLHSFATFLGGTIYLGIWLPKYKDSNFYYRLALLSFLLVCIGIASISWPVALPDMINEYGNFTLQAIILNTVGGIAFLLVSVKYTILFLRVREPAYYSLITHSCLFGIAAIAYSFSSLWDSVWWLSHTLRLLAYWIIVAFFFQVTMFTCDDKDENETGLEKWRLLLPSGITVILGITLSIYLFQLFYQKEQEYIKENFTNLASQHLVSFKHKIQEAITSLSALQAFYDSSDSVTYDAFLSYTDALHKKLPYISALAWVPKVTADERYLIEQGAKNNGQTNFQFRELLNDSVLIEARERETYFPILYIYPHENNEAFVGYDLASNPTVMRSIKSAIQSKKITASAPLTAFEFSSNHTPINFYTPVFKQGENDSLSLYGVTAITINIPELIIHGLKLNTRGIKLFVTDITNPSNPESVYSSTTFHKTGSQYKKELSKIKINQFLTAEETLEVAERTWLIQIIGDNEYFGFSYSVWGWVSLILGLALSITLSAYLFTMATQREIIKRTVDIKTRALRQAEQKLSSILHSAGEGIYGIDKEGNTIFANTASEKFLGFRETDLLGKSLHSVIHHSYEDGTPYPASECHILASVQQGKPMTLEKEVFWHKNGQALPVEYTTTPIRYDDEISGAVVVFKDISERKKAEEERESLITQLTQSNGELERFAHIASHDLQEPLRMVKNFSELLQNKYSDELNQEARKYLSFCTKGANKMQSLVNDLLEYSRVTKNTSIKEPINMYKLLELAIENLELSIQQHNAIIEYDDSLPTVYGIPIQILSVVQNIISNALKYQKHGVQPMITVTWTEEEDYWQFAFDDNGIGINEKHLDDIFDPFKRLHTKDEYPGTGLGLSLCKKIIESHGGRVWANSKPDEGSTFYFSIEKVVTGQEDDQDE